MREAGLADVTERRVKVPIGPWPKDKRLKHWGTWNRQFLLQALEGFSIRGMTELLGVGFFSPCSVANQSRCWDGGLMRLF